MKRYGNAFRAYGKRILAVVLACLMIMGIMPEKTSAASVNDAVLAAQFIMTMQVSGIIK